MYADILRTRVNNVIGVLFVGSFALAAGLIVWHAAFGYNPIENMLVSYVQANQAAIAQ